SCLPVCAQVPGLPIPSVAAVPRDTAPSKVGTAIVRGRVVASDNGQPLRRAQVRIMGPELREGRLANTDGEGRYEITEIPAGRYTVTASKGSFVTLQFGQTRAFE